MSRRSKTLFFTSTLVLALTVAGCATPYQPDGLSGGYTDYRAGLNTIYVEFSGNGYTPRSTVVKYWHRRAAEVCGGKAKYQIVAMDAEDTTSSYGNYRTTHRGTVTSVGNEVRYSGSSTTQEPITVTKHRASGYIRCVGGGSYRTSRAPSLRSESSRLVARRNAQGHERFWMLIYRPGLKIKLQAVPARYSGVRIQARIKRSRSEQGCGLAMAADGTKVALTPVESKTSEAHAYLRATIDLGELAAVSDATRVAVRACRETFLFGTKDLSKLRSYVLRVRDAVALLPPR